MAETSSSPALPGWVTKRDGRLVPFEPDKISRALFAATESLGRPDAFLAQELTGGILHFLAAETDGVSPTTAQIADVAVKVVRELGQPALAQALADFEQPPHRHQAETRDVSTPEPGIVCSFSADASVAVAVRSCLHAYSLHAVFSRDLAAAQADGLITLTGLEAPLQLTGCVLEPMPHRTDAADRAGLFLVEAIEQARQFTGQWLTIDGPEHGLDGSRAVGEYTRELGIGLRATGLGAIVNLNCATPPPWADNLAEGPLFAGHRQPLPPERRADLASALLESLLAPGGGLDRVRVDWHLGERDFAPEAAARLLRLARLGTEVGALAFTFDRPRQSVALAEGLDRRHAAVLLTVGLHLPRLAQLAGVGGDPELFLEKLGSLARLALSAAARKRDFLRRRDRGVINRGFLLDRARLVVTPVGLEAAVRTFSGDGICASRPAAEFARRVVLRLRDVLRQEGPPYQLDACLDGGCAFALEHAAAHDAPAGSGVLSAWGPGFLDQPAQLEDVAGLTPWDPTAAPRAQLKSAALLHGAADAGTAAVLLPQGQPALAEQAAEWLRAAWRHSDLVRLRFIRLAQSQKQLTAPWLGEA